MAEKEGGVIPTVEHYERRKAELFEIFIQDAHRDGFDKGEAYGRRLASKQVVPPQFDGWWVVYPGSEKLDLGEKKAIALFEFAKHADAYIAQMWPGYGYKEKLVGTKDPNTPPA